jgi:hypothetical protein
MPRLSMNPVLAVLAVMIVTAGCISSGSPAPKDLPTDKLDQILGNYNYNGTAWIVINPVSDHTVGETFVVTATTDLPPGDMVLVQTWPVSFARADRYVIHNGTSRNVTVTAGNTGVNTISLEIGAAEFRQGTYLISIVKAPEVASAATWYNVTARR